VSQVLWFISFQTALGIISVPPVLTLPWIPRFSSLHQEAWKQIIKICVTAFPLSTPFSWD